MRKMFWVISVLIVLVFVILGGMIWVGAQLWKTSTNPSDTVAIVIEPGASTHQIAEQLKEADLIDSVWLFEVFVRFVKRDNLLQAGSYALPRGQGLASLFTTLRYGMQTTDVSVTIPEGYTLAQIGELVKTKLAISVEDWQAATGVDSSFEGTMPLLQSKPDSVDLEGYLFPDTYRFAQNATAEDVVGTMLETMSQRIGQVAPVFSEGEDSLSFPQNLHEVLTLASIIEREVMTDADRGLVSGIFWNRLTIGMALQADSTVNYVTGKKTPGISLDDRDIDSPYNTYQHTGLPPGPISNPGLASITAAANPTSNPYYYFLTSKDGQVIYAKTHDEHVANKALYR